MLSIINSQASLLTFKSPQVITDSIILLHNHGPNIYEGLSYLLFQISIHQQSYSSVQLLSHVRLFVTPGTTAHQASLSITNSQSSPKLMSIELVMLYNHLILWRPLLLLPSIIPNIRVFSNESALRHQVAKVLESQLQHQSFQ